MVADHLAALVPDRNPDIFELVNGPGPLISEIPAGSPVPESAQHGEQFMEALRPRAGSWLGCSPWTSISNREADTFAVMTGGSPADRLGRPRPGDRQETGLVDPLHLLSLRAFFLPYLGLPVLSDELMAAFNYGLDRARWHGPVPAEHEFRDHVLLQAVTRKRPGGYLIATRHLLEVRGSDRAAMTADYLSMYVVSDASEGA